MTTPTRGNPPLSAQVSRTYGTNEPRVEQKGQQVPPTQYQTNAAYAQAWGAQPPRLEAKGPQQHPPLRPQRPAQPPVGVPTQPSTATRVPVGRGHQPAPKH